MAKRTALTTEQYLIQAALPEATDSYTVVAHGDVISRVKKLIADKGLEIESEFYKCNIDARVAQGIYHLKYGNDPDLGMMFTWVNSYDKTMRFRCAIGAYVHQSLSHIINGNMGSYGRKHTGDADQEVIDTITEQLTNASTYFDQIILDKNKMKSVMVSEEARAGFIGKLYIKEESITAEQISIIKSEIKRPSFTYAEGEHSLWALYNSIIYSLQKAHPKNWFAQQRLNHFLTCKEFNLDTFIGVEAKLVENQEVIENPNQLNLLDQIAETETISVLEEVLDELAVSMLDAISTNPEVTIEKEEEPVIEEPIVTSEVGTDDLNWNCLKCGKIQGAADIFHDGQLCSECATN